MVNFNSVAINVSVIRQHSKGGKITVSYNKYHSVNF